MDLATKQDIEALASQLLEIRRTLASLAVPSLRPPESRPPLTRPLSAADVDKTLRLQKGTTMRAVRAGLLPASMRRGRGGNDWPRIQPADAERWFLAGCPGSTP
jgi:hypothetical protein